MDAATRDGLLARFADYLDAVDETAALDAAGQAPDLFSLFAEVAALKNEVRLESRQVKTALDQFREAFELIRQAQARLEDSEIQRREAERRARQDSERDLLLELLDLRDRLQAAHDQAGRYRPGWLARRGGAGEFVAAMSTGLGMNLRRLDELLARRGLEPLAVLGRPFDPRIMHAAEAGRDPAQADGLVLAELRRGFVSGERLLRAAEVVVNRLAPAQEQA
jgi:molecular chaperone GrpE